MPSKKTSKPIDFEEFKRRADSPFETAQAGQDFMVELEWRARRTRLSTLQTQTLILRMGQKVFWNTRRIKEARLFNRWWGSWLAKIAEKYNNREIRRVLAGKRGR